jgi:hypothetical protein
MLTLWWNMVIDLFEISSKASQFLTLKQGKDMVQHLSTLGQITPMY